MPSLLEELERRLLTAIFSRDRVTMTELMHPGGYGFDATMGLVDQRALIDGIGALAPGAGFEVTDVQVVPGGPEVTALTYRLRQWGDFGGRSLPEVVHCSSVWRRDGGEWQAVFHHETPARRD